MPATRELLLAMMRSAITGATATSFMMYNDIVANPSALTYIHGRKAKYIFSSKSEAERVVARFNQACFDYGITNYEAAMGLREPFCRYETVLILQVKIGN